MKTWYETPPLPMISSLDRPETKVMDSEFEHE